MEDSRAGVEGAGFGWLSSSLADSIVMSGLGLKSAVTSKDIETSLSTVSSRDSDL